ncbi:mCG145513, partial [Mus musculus]
SKSKLGKKGFIWLTVPEFTNLFFFFNPPQKENSNTVLVEVHQEWYMTSTQKARGAGFLSVMCRPRFWHTRARAPVCRSENNSWGPETELRLETVACHSTLS